MMTRGAPAQSTWQAACKIGCTAVPRYDQYGTEGNVKQSSLWRNRSNSIIGIAVKSAQSPAMDGSRLVLKVQIDLESPPTLR